MKQQPKVLVVSINAWRENSGINTLMNIFSGWDPARLSQIYTRAELPATKVCERFFQISESRVLRSVYKHRTVTGREVQAEAITTGETIAVNEEAKAEQARYRKGGHSSVLRIAREFVWKLGRWKTEELDAYVTDVDPDVLFFPVYPTVYMGRIQLHVLKKTKKPVVLYISDDNYSYRAVGGDLLMRFHRFFLRRVVRKLVKNSRQVMVIAPKQKEEYDRLFGIDCTVITKGIDYTDCAYTPILPHTPVRMVYTGKLIIGRWESLALIADAMEALNRDTTRVTLDIYTTDTLTDEQSAALNRGGCTVRGAVTLEEARRVQSEADVCVFVEALSRRHRDTARLSFSTKLTDYFLAGKCILAVGGEEIAPIDYLRREDAGLVASSAEEIASALGRLVADPTLADAYGQKAFECGRRNHESSMIRELFNRKMQEAADTAPKKGDA